MKVLTQLKLKLNFKSNFNFNFNFSFRADFSFSFRVEVEVELELSFSSEAEVQAEVQHQLKLQYSEDAPYIQSSWLAVAPGFDPSLIFPPGLRRATPSVGARMARSSYGLLRRRPATRAQRRCPRPFIQQPARSAHIMPRSLLFDLFVDANNFTANNNSRLRGFQIGAYVRSRPPRLDARVLATLFLRARGGPLGGTLRHRAGRHHQAPVLIPRHRCLGGPPAPRRSPRRRVRSARTTSQRAASHL
jgi:hypothetical protein